MDFRVAEDGSPVKSRPVGPPVNPSIPSRNGSGEFWCLGCSSAGRQSFCRQEPDGWLTMDCAVVGLGLPVEGTNFAALG